MLQSGLDPDYIWLDPQKDYILKVPPGGIHGTVEIDGGHNVVMIGGSITVPSTANQTDNGSDDTDTGIYIRQSTGTVHIEGVEITGDPDTQFDGIDVNAPLATVQLENIRVTNVWGSDTTEHADVVQTWGGVSQLRIDRLSGDGDYQGLTIDPDLGPVGSVDLENVDLTYDARPPDLASMTVGGGYMVWLTKGVDTCSAPSQTALSNVYVYDKSERVPASNTIWPPSVGTTLPCAGELSGTVATWNKLPVTGHVDLTAPPNGPYVPPGVAGDSYTSPGYGPGTSGLGLSVSAPASGTAASAISPAAISGSLSRGSSPRGTITFKVFGPQSSPPTACTSGGTTVGAANASGNGSYSPSTGFTPGSAGDYWWYASYDGDSNNNSANSGCGASMAETVVSAIGGGGGGGPIASATGVSCSPSPSQPGQPVTCTATVSPVPNGGTVDFTDHGATIQSCGAVGIDPFLRTAICTTSFASAGSYELQAVYSGNSFYAGSPSSVITQNVTSRGTGGSLEKVRLVGSPKSRDNRVTFKVTCSGRVGQSCVVTDMLRRHRDAQTQSSGRFLGGTSLKPDDSGGQHQDPHDPAQRQLPQATQARWEPSGHSHRPADRAW